MVNRKFKHGRNLRSLKNLHHRWIVPQSKAQEHLTRMHLTASLSNPKGGTQIKTSEAR